MALFFPRKMKQLAHFQLKVLNTYKGTYYDQISK